MLPDLKRIFQDYRSAGAFHELLGVQTAVDKHTFATKGGSLFQVLRVEGIDPDGLTDADLEHLTRRLETAHKIFDESFRVYHYFIKRPCGPLPRSPHENPVVREAVENRTNQLDAMNLFRVELFIAVVYEGWRDTQRSAMATMRSRLSAQTRIASLETTLKGACSLLASKVDRFRSEVSTAVRADVLDGRQAFRFLYGLLNLAPHKQATAGLRYDAFVDYQLCDSALECHCDHLRLDEYFVQTFTLKEPPAQTTANALKSLVALPYSFILVTEWKRASHASMRRFIQSKRRHFHNSKVSALNYVTGSDHAPKDVLVDQSAAALVNHLGVCLEEMEVNGRAFGTFSLSIALFGQDPAELRRAVADCYKAAGTADITLTEERYNGLNAFLSIVPGNDAFNVRRIWISNANYADLAPVFAPNIGEPRNETLKSEALAVFETSQHTPYFFNLHSADVAHTLVLGKTGSGKSFLLNFLLTHAQQYRPYTFICDLGGSYESLTTLFGGTYVPVSLESPSFSINPFHLPLTPENHRFLLSLLRVLIESGGYVMTAQEETDVFEQIENLYAVEPSQRRLLTLSNIVGRRLREQLARWVQGGPYASVFDNVKDNLTFARFQTFDFQQMDKVPHLLEPLLFYVLHRANDVILDPALATTFKMFVADEAWRLLRHPAIRNYVQEGLKTWRKNNAAMILATQSGDDLVKSDLLPVVVESCGTTLFLANPGMDARTYQETFHLNEVEAMLIANLTPKKQFLIKRAGFAKIVNLHVDPRSYWIYTNNPFDNHKRREAFERLGFERGLDELTRSNS